MRLNLTKTKIETINKIICDYCTIEFLEVFVCIKCMKLLDPQNYYCDGFSNHYCVDCYGKIEDVKNIENEAVKEKKE
jgi:hypothetical protein